MSDQVVILYRASTGGKVWLYNSSSEPVVHNFETYSPIPIQHSIRTISASDDHLKLEVTFSSTKPLADIDFDKDDVYLQLFRGEFGQDNFLQFFHGYITSKTIDAIAGTCKLTVDHAALIFSRDLLPAVPAPTCQKQVYEPGCGLNFEDWKEAVDIIQVDGKTLDYTSATSYADNYFASGLARYNGEYRTIVSNTGTQITVSRPFQSILPGVTLEVSRGCDRLYTTCQNTFSNLDNFLGDPFIPVKNIFTEGMK